FRVVAGGLIGIFGSSISVVTIAGPVGTFIGRIIMSFITGASLKALIFAASIGMVYTAISSYLVFKLIKNITINTSYKEFIVRKNKFKRKRERDGYELI
ncbi:MAG: hypothetical protein E6269_11320, partial [Clostridiales bacterium]|nr:hypothetical protein [Clostridiales bacterium]